MSTKATVIDDPKKKFVVGLDAEKVFSEPQITICANNMNVVKEFGTIGEFYGT